MTFNPFEIMIGLCVIVLTLFIAPYFLSLEQNEKYSQLVDVITNAVLSVEQKGEKSGAGKKKEEVRQIADEWMKDHFFKISVTQVESIIEAAVYAMKMAEGLLKMGQNEDFINKIAPIIRKYAAERGYKVASPIIAQACLESFYGRSKLSAVYHNYFGLKCGKSWKGKAITANTKEEFTPGTLTEIKDAFRVYGNMEEGVRGYFDFINTNRYSNLKTATTPKQYLETIKADGYATDSKYVSKNMSVIEKYKLTQYDTMAANDTTAPKTGNPYPEPTGVIRLGSRGNHVRWLQYQLNCHGAKLVVDGMAGTKTIQALKNFQMANGLEADEVCGEKSQSGAQRVIGW